MKPLFYAVRRITRGPRGGLQKVDVVGTRSSKTGAITKARNIHASTGAETDAVGIIIEHNRFAVLDTVWSSRRG